MSNRSRVVAVLVATLALLLTSCGSGEQQVADVPADEGQTATETVTVPENVATQRPQEPGDLGATLNVLNQLGDGEQVVISSASTDGAYRALAVVYDDEDDAPGRPLGYGEVPAAGEGGLTVTLDEPITETGSHQLWVVMHIDADPLGTFDPGVDAAITIDGDTLRDDFTYTVTSS